MLTLFPLSVQRHGEGEGDAVVMGDEKEERSARVISDRVADSHFCFVHSKDDARLYAAFPQLFILPSVQWHHANGLDHMAQKRTLERRPGKEDE